MYTHFMFVCPDRVGVVCLRLGAGQHTAARLHCWLRVHMHAMCSLHMAPGTYMPRKKLRNVSSLLRSRLRSSRMIPQAARQERHARMRRVMRAGRGPKRQSGGACPPSSSVRWVHAASEAP